MKFLMFIACIIGTALCAPQPQMYMEFDFHHAPAHAVLAAPAGAPAGSLEVLLPVNAQRQPAAGATHGFIKQEVPQPNGRESYEILYPFGQPAAPAAPVAPVAPVAPAAPAAPAAPIVQYVAVAPPARPAGDDDEEDDE